MEEVAILVPLIFFASLTAIIATPFYFKHRNRRLVYQAIQQQVEKTGNVDPKLIEAITHDSVGPQGDLRRAVLLVAFAVGLALCGAFIPNEMAKGILSGMACVPLLMGLGFGVLHFFFPREKTV